MTTLWHALINAGVSSLRVDVEAARWGSIETGEKGAKGISNGISDDPKLGTGERTHSGLARPRRKIQRTRPEVDGGRGWGRPGREKG